MNALLRVSASFLYNEIRAITPQLIKVFKNRMINRNDHREKDKEYDVSLSGSNQRFV